MQKNIDKETQEFLTWLKNKYKDIDELKISEMQKDGSLEKEYNEFLKSKALKAEHGAKLNYFRKLKRICSDDEELVYFKRGGSIDCGCVKKEEGGKAPQKKSSNKAVEDFKNKKLDLATKDSIAANVYNDQEVQDTKPGFYKKNKNGKVQWTPDRTKAPYKKTCGGSMKKKYLNGGSLNGIPFYLEGTNKGGITEKSDNTRVLRIPNNGSYTTEPPTPLGWQDFVPVLGTYREAKRLDANDPNASKAGLIVSLLGDLVGAEMVGPVVRAASKYNKISKALKARKFFPGSREGIYIKQGATGTINRASGNVKQIPLVDYTSAVMAPLVQTLRVPGLAMAH